MEVEGAIVRRPRHPWTPTVHAVLVHLRSSGLTVVPAPLGIGVDHETVSALAGAAGADCWPHQATAAGLRSAARLLREIHDATVGFDPPPDAVWALPPTEPREVICNGDPGPWNMVWLNGRAAGLFDWDLCHPGPRIEDVANALEYFAPFRDDAAAMRWHGFPAPPDRVGRIRTFCAEYGISSEGVVDVVIELQHRRVTHVTTLAEQCVQPQADWVLEGHLDELSARVAWSEQHRHLLR